MKTIFCAALAAIALSSCGSSAGDASSSALTEAPAIAARAATTSDLTERYASVQASHATIESVKVRRVRGGSVTDVTLGFQLGCLDDLGDVAYTATSQRGKVRLLVSAHALISNQADRVRCLVANYEKRTVTLSGALRASAIELVELEDFGTTALVAGDLGLTRLDRAEVVAAGPICPPNPSGISCMAVGSHATLRVTLGSCADRLGNVASHFERRGDGKVDLFLKVLDVTTEASSRVRCFAAATAEISLVTPESVRRASDLVVHVLK